VFHLDSLLNRKQYDVPARPKPGERAKPQTPDQLLKCKIYMREANKLWAECKRELGEKLREFVARGMVMSARSEASSKADSDAKSGPSSYRSEAKSERAEAKTVDDEGSRKLKSESAYLYQLSIGRMKEWLEGDDDKLAATEREDKTERDKLAKKEHEEWVKKKDSLRIRLPDADDVSHMLVACFIYRLKLIIPLFF